MQSRHLALIAVVLTAALALVVPVAHARSIAAHGRAVTRVGALDVSNMHNSRPRDAKRVFGPAHTLINHENHCKLSWPRLHLVLDYWSYGIVRGSACADTFLQEADAGTGWQTARGLKVGATVSRLQSIYPHARRVGARWALMPYPSPFGPLGSTGSPLWAVVRQGYVAQLQAFVGDAGE